MASTLVLTSEMTESRDEALSRVWACELALATLLLLGRLWPLELLELLELLPARDDDRPALCIDKGDVGGEEDEDDEEDEDEECDGGRPPPAAEEDRKKGAAVK